MTLRLLRLTSTTSHGSVRLRACPTHFPYTSNHDISPNLGLPVPVLHCMNSGLNLHLIQHELVQRPGGKHTIELVSGRYFKIGIERMRLWSQVRMGGPYGWARDMRTR